MTGGAHGGCHYQRLFLRRTMKGISHMGETTTLTPLEQFAESYARPNATFDGKPVPLRNLKSMKMVRAIDFLISSYRETGVRQNFTFSGSAGIGKTAMAKYLPNASGVQVVYFNCANIDAENFILPTIQGEPGAEYVQAKLLRHLQAPGEKILIFDEPGQGDAGTRAAMMELMSEGTCAGNVIPDLAAIVLLDNPSSMMNGDLSEADLAQADRGGFLTVTAADTLWEYGLALEFPTLDLKDFFSTYYRLPLDERSREVLSPRVLEHIIKALTLGFNAHRGRPIMHDQYIPFTSMDGTDISDTVIDKLAAALKIPNPPMSSGDFDRAIALIPTHGLDVIAYGTQGTGKTSRAKALLEKSGVQVIYKSVPMISKEDINLSVVSPDGNFVDLIPDGAFVMNSTTVGIFDEVTRGSRRTTNALMEVIQEHALGGRPLPHYAGSLMLTNLAKTGEEEMDVEEVSLPFATRPDLNFILDVEDLHALDYLVEKYGDEILPFVEWWRLDLDGQPEYRLLASPRFLERAFRFWKKGLDIQWALPAPHGEYVAVPLVKLNARLAGSPMLSFLNLVEDTDRFFEALSEVDPATGDHVDPETHLAVYTAMLNAELPTLEAYEDVCVRLFAPLSAKWKFKLLQSGDKKWDFWYRVTTANPGDTQE